MRIYRSHGMSKEQREKIKEYDRKRSEAKWLKKKIGKEIDRENNCSRKHSNRAKLKIPTSPTKYGKLVSKVVKVAEKDSVKSNILIKSLGAYKIPNCNSSKPLSVLELQALKNKNRVQEHAALVSKFKKHYGSLRKASTALGVNWKTMQCLSQPLVKKTKQIRDIWVDIKTFYQRDNISQELPSVLCQGRRYMTKTLEESYHCYVEDCLKTSKSTWHFLPFVGCILQKCTLLAKLQTGNAFVKHVRIKDFSGLHLSITISKALNHTQIYVPNRVCVKCVKVMLMMMASTKFIQITVTFSV